MGDPRWDALDRLEAQPHEELLEELASLRQRAKGREDLRVPRVTLHLRSGRDVSGWVLACSQLRGYRQVLLHDPGMDPRSAEFDAVHVPLGAVDAITVHDAISLELEPARSEPAPGRLQLQRRANEAMTALGGVSGVTPTAEVLCEPTTPDALLWAVSDLIELARQALLATAADGMGKSALTELTRVTFGASEKPGAEKKGDALVLSTALKARNRLDLRQLQEAIAGVL